jgi:hypothetical protein
VNVRAWPAPAIFFVIAFVGEAILRDEPDWLIFLVAIAAGLLVAALMRVAGPRR